jgi:hypothetical protein
MTKFVITKAEDAPDSPYVSPFYSDDTTMCYFPRSDEQVSDYDLVFDTLEELLTYAYANGWTEPTDI